MFKTRKKLRRRLVPLLALGLTALFVGAVACEREEPTPAVTVDDPIERDFSGFDADEDGRLSGAEFGEVLFSEWDLDDDRLVDDDEFGRGLSDWFDGELGDDDLLEWDGNRDRVLDETEFGDAVDDAGYHATWDLDDDGLVDEDEFNTGVMSSARADRGDLVRPGEWGG